MTTVVQMTQARYANSNLILCGQAIQRGEIVLPILTAANGDSSVFPEPDIFDIQRESHPHLAFGTGVHVCLGLKLAKIEVEIALQRLFTRFPDLQLAVANNKLVWWQRVGLRAIKSMQVTLNSHKKQ